MNIYDSGTWLVISIVAVVGPGLLAGCLTWAAFEWRDRRKLRQAVYGNLDSAYEGGQFEADGYLHSEPAGGIAYDLTCYAEDLLDREPAELLPYVRDWMFQKGIPCKG